MLQEMPVHTRHTSFLPCLNYTSVWSHTYEPELQMEAWENLTLLPGIRKWNQKTYFSYNFWFLMRGVSLLFEWMQWKDECVYDVTDQGWDPKPYHASWRIWKPRPSRIVFLFPMDRIRIPNTTVCRGTAHRSQRWHRSHKSPLREHTVTQQKVVIIFNSLASWLLRSAKTNTWLIYGQKGHLQQ